MLRRAGDERAGNWKRAVHVSPLRHTRRPTIGSHSNEPYLTYPNEPPISFRFYYQVTL